MKLFLRLLTASVLVSSSAVGLTACSIPSVGDVWIITDGGDLLDKAFNQQVLEGTQEFTNRFNDHRTEISKLPGFESWENHPMRTKWIISRDPGVDTLRNNYSLAAFAGAKVIILSGFHHLGALTPELQTFYQNIGVRFILVDAKLQQPQNVAGLTYSAEQSGFLAGLAGAIWLVAHHEVYDKNGLSMSTFGGLPVDTIISYMMGYYWGVYYLNNYRAQDDKLLTMVNEIRVTAGKDKMEEDDFINNHRVTFNKVDNQFTGSFDSGTANARALTELLVDRNKNAIVMGVAGAQTIDLLATINKSRENPEAKASGVDVNQSEQYEGSKGTFITSALKGIHKSVATWLWHGFDLIDNGDTQAPTKDDHGIDYFNGVKPQSPLAGNGYTGIAKDDAIKVIFDELTAAKGIYVQNLAFKVTAAFTKLSDDLINNPDQDKWEKAWKQDVVDNPTNPEYKPQFDDKKG